MRSPLLQWWCWNACRDCYVLPFRVVDGHSRMQSLLEARHESCRQVVFRSCDPQQCSNSHDVVSFPDDFSLKVWLARLVPVHAGGAVRLGVNLGRGWKLTWFINACGTSAWPLCLQLLVGWSSNVSTGYCPAARVQHGKEDQVCQPANGLFEVQEGTCLWSYTASGLEHEGLEIIWRSFIYYW